MHPILPVTIDPRCQRFAWRFDLGGLDSQRAFEEAFVEFNDVLDADPTSYDVVLAETKGAYVRFFGIPEDEISGREMELLISARAGDRLRFLNILLDLRTCLHPLLRDTDDVYYEGVNVIGARDGLLLQLRQGNQHARLGARRRLN